ncbi:MAG: class I SAM-dependent methyltransferase [Lysobacter sp.]
MPLLSHRRQPDTALGWFGTQAGQGLIGVENVAMARVLAIGPALPWAWLGVAADAAPEVGDRRGLLLRRDGGGFTGSVRCALPLPIASESLGVVLLQHLLDDGVSADVLLGECERVLAPGGTLWLATLNPWSPYRARWLGTGLHARNPGYWQAALRRAGFALDSVSLQWLGPRWDPAHGEAGIGAADRLRAGVALTISKRVHAAIPPRPLRNLHWQAGRMSRSRTSPAIMRR